MEPPQPLPKKKLSGKNDPTNLVRREYDVLRPSRPSDVEPAPPPFVGARLSPPPSLFSGRSMTSLLFGQVLSALVAGMGVTSTQLATECGFSCPASQTLMVYVLLAFHLLPSCLKYLRREAGQRGRCLRVAWYNYVGLAILDVQGNYLFVLAYRYTSVVNITLLDCTTIPFVMAWTRCFLSRSYGRHHFFGAACAVTGLVLIAASDYFAGTENPDDDLDAGQSGTRYPHALRGDLLVVLGSAFYALSNTMSELLVKSYDLNEYLGMLGLCGIFVSLFQIATLSRDETDAVSSLFLSGPEAEDFGTCGRDGTFWVLIRYIFLALFFYVGTAHFLRVSEATLFNLSLLTADLWVLLYSIIREHFSPSSWYFAAAGIIVAGVVCYETGPSPVIELCDEGDCILPSHTNERRVSVVLESDASSQNVRNDLSPRVIT